jgi:DNA (cytosine-5)-methyltransferase 1
VATFRKDAAMNKRVTQHLRFIDLFAGLGGFHQALASLGHECVFACEIDESLASLYEKNFGLAPHRDIRTLDVDTVPADDILCAGFPCQPFSKAGDQEGLKCPQWGDLIDYVIAILRAHAPRYFIIENVPNLVRHNNGATWRTIEHRLRLAGYSVRDGILSPHQFGVPQIRDRAFIVGCREVLDGFVWPKARNVELSIRSILDERPKGAKPLGKNFLKYLRAWQKFLSRFPKGEQLPSFPIWAMEFGATYPFEDKSPAGVGWSKLGSFKGSLGTSLKGLSKEEVLAALSYSSRAQVEEGLAHYFRNGKEAYEEYVMDNILRK